MIKAMHKKTVIAGLLLSTLAPEGFADEAQMPAFDFIQLSNAEQERYINGVLDRIFRFYSEQAREDVTDCMTRVFLELPVTDSSNGYFLVVNNSVSAMNLPLTDQPTVERIVLGVVLSQCVEPLEQ